MHKTLSGDVFALDYHLSSIPKDGACPSKSSPLFLASTDVLLKSPSPAFRSVATRFRYVNLTQSALVRA
jgi:hypothetical protein